MPTRLKSFLKSISFFRFKAAFRSFTKIEKFAFFIFLLFFAAGLTWQGLRIYFLNTELKAATGGIFTEGIVGMPRYINPVFGDSGDADRALESLIFAGLFKGDYQGGVIADLAESYEISKDGKVYTITLKDGLFWHDGKPLTADDIIFTIELIKAPELKNPLAPNWNGVEVEKISSKTIRFTLPAPYQPFLHNLTFGILPRHLWGQIPIQNFMLAELNLKPIGAGPYRFKNLQKDRKGAISQYTLVANRNYPGPGPYLDTVIIKFFPSYEDALLSLKKREIDGLGGIP
ncbi:MAG: ABC transporter substrate-binding protein, partial [Candidatus Paceibacteria bacterium]